MLSGIGRNRAYGWNNSTCNACYLLLPIQGSDTPYIPFRDPQVDNLQSGRLNSQISTEHPNLHLRLLRASPFSIPASPTQPFSPLQRESAAQIALVKTRAIPKPTGAWHNTPAPDQTETVATQQSQQSQQTTASSISMNSSGQSPLILVFVTIQQLTVDWASGGQIFITKSVSLASASVIQNYKHNHLGAQVELIRKKDSFYLSYYLLKLVDSTFCSLGRQYDLLTHQCRPRLLVDPGRFLVCAYSGLINQPFLVSIYMCSQDGHGFWSSDVVFSSLWEICTE